MWQTRRAADTGDRFVAAEYSLPVAVLVFFMVPKVETSIVL